MTDKDLKIEEQEAKLNLYKDEMKIMRESNELFQRKIDNIYTNNILIAKEGMQGTNKVEESKEDDRD